MKNKFLFTTAIFIVGITACRDGQKNTNETHNVNDSATIIPPPSDNNSATNPSVADTAYNRGNTDTLNRMRKDSSGIRNY